MASIRVVAGEVGRGGWKHLEDRCADGMLVGRERGLESGLLFIEMVKTAGA